MAEAFNLAVSALLQHADPLSRAQANNWLEAWQQTPEAWTVAIDVLQHSQSIDAQYFAAQTLRTKARTLHLSQQMFGYYSTMLNCETSQWSSCSSGRVGSHTWTPSLVSRHAANSQCHGMRLNTLTQQTGAAGL